MHQSEPLAKILIKHIYKLVMSKTLFTTVQYIYLRMLPAARKHKDFYQPSTCNRTKNDLRIKRAFGNSCVWFIPAQVLSGLLVYLLFYQNVKTSETRAVRRSDKLETKWQLIQITVSVEVKLKVSARRFTCSLYAD